MPETHDPLDMFPTIGLCVSCGREIKYSPFKMPKGRPMINPEKPGHASIEYVTMCLWCVKKQLHVVEEKIKRGELYPEKTWDLEGDSPRIVTISNLLPPEEAEEHKEEPKPEAPKPRRLGLIRLLARAVVAVIRFLY